MLISSRVFVQLTTHQCLIIEAKIETIDSFSPELHVLKLQQILDFRKIAQLMQTTRLSHASRSQKINTIHFIQHDSPPYDTNKTWPKCH